jgi:hypothetical protein
MRGYGGADGARQGKPFTRAASRVNSWVRLSGTIGSPSSRPHTQGVADCRTPSANSASACSRLCRRSSPMANAGRLIVLPLLDLAFGRTREEAVREIGVLIEGWLEVHQCVVRQLH